MAVIFHRLTALVHTTGSQLGVAWTQREREREETLCLFHHALSSTSKYESSFSVYWVRPQWKPAVHVLKLNATQNICPGTCYGESHGQHSQVDFTSSHGLCKSPPPPTPPTQPPSLTCSSLTMETFILRTLAAVSFLYVATNGNSLQLTTLHTYLCGFCCLAAQGGLWQSTALEGEMADGQTGQCARSQSFTMAAKNTT